MKRSDRSMLYGVAAVLAVGAGVWYYERVKVGDQVVVPITSLVSVPALPPGVTRAVVGVTAASGDQLQGNIVGYVNDANNQVTILPTPIGTASITRSQITGRVKNGVAS